AQGWYLARPMEATAATAWLLNRMALCSDDLGDVQAEVTA
ncbi:MAG: hypothetical protein QOF82_1833, partial [Frankiales bacterium]|nr:hypothetical protein [Frankiales bacterium]